VNRSPSCARPTSGAGTEEVLLADATTSHSTGRGSVPFSVVLNWTAGLVR
jgi:hypothetical protein